MSFTGDWLTLRQGPDLRARNAEVAAALSAVMAGREGLRVLDIGAGSGNNMCATAPLLGQGQHWLLCDNDAALLDRAIAACPEGVSAEPVVHDLARGVAPLLSPGPDLVTASAFFDLCGAAWIDAFVADLARCRAPLYAVLSYDGREVWEPSHPLDAAVLEAFRADQGRDKGLGPSLGPGAHDYLARTFRAAGYRVIEGGSDWELTQPRDCDLIAELSRGSAAAVSGILGPARAEEWRVARRSADRVTIGHKDLLALPQA